MPMAVLVSCVSRPHKHWYRVPGALNDVAADTADWLKAVRGIAPTPPTVETVVHSLPCHAATPDRSGRYILS